VIYIQSARPEQNVCSVSRVGWHNDCFVLPDSTIGIEEEQVIFQSPGTAEHGHKIAGTLDSWRDAVARLCSGNSRLLFAVSCAFAAPLPSLVNLESGGFHLRGASSSGKTTLLIVAGSVWGGRGQSGFLQTWRATANGLETTAELHNNVLLCLDELGQVEPKEAGEIAYMLSNGRGKNRATKMVTTRRALTWNLLFLSTGEISLATHMQSGGKRTRAGQEVRLLDIDADAGGQMGAFQDLHGTATPDELARVLVSAAKQHYGTPARSFLEFVVDHRDEVVLAIQRFSDDFLAQNLPNSCSGAVIRPPAARAFKRAKC
jgi:putative DNA primase/helicase